jgi:hypothetical protein
MPTRHQSHRLTARSTLRSPFRNCNRCCLRGRRSGPGDFAQMLIAYGRAIRAHRRLARLAPSFFDAAVVARERENRAEQRRWMAMWEPHVAKAYGVDPKPVADRVPLPPLPPPRIQRAVDRQLAELSLWLAAAHAARERHRQCRPHALPTLTQLARLLQLAFDLKKMILGLDSKNPLPEKITYDYKFTDLKRGYGHLLDPAPSAVASDGTIASGAATDGAIAGGAATDGLCGSHPANRAAPNTPPSSVAPPVEQERPVVPVSPPAAMPQTEPRRCDAWSRWARQIRMRRA